MWDIILTPALRVQSGQPFGRTFNAGAANGINYGSQRILAEPLGTRKQDDIVILDLRAEKRFKVVKSTTHLGVRSTSTTSATPTPRRTSRGSAVRRSCCRRRSSDHASRGSA